MNYGAGNVTQCEADAPDGQSTELVVSECY